jgi:hypothetical protein
LRGSLGCCEGALEPQTNEVSRCVAKLPAAGQSQLHLQRVCTALSCHRPSSRTLQVLYTRHLQLSSVASGHDARYGNAHRANPMPRCRPLRPFHVSLPSNRAQAHADRQTQASTYTVVWTNIGIESTGIGLRPFSAGVQAQGLEPPPFNLTAIRIGRQQGRQADRQAGRWIKERKRGHLTPRGRGTVTVVLHADSILPHPRLT